MTTLCGPNTHNQLTPKMISIFTRRLPAVRNMAFRTLSTVSPPPPLKSEVHIKKLELPIQEAPTPEPPVKYISYETGLVLKKSLDIMHHLFVITLSTIFVLIVAINYPLLFVIGLVLFAVF